MTVLFAEWPPFLGGGWVGGAAHSVDHGLSSYFDCL